MHSSRLNRPAPLPLQDEAAVMCVALAAPYVLVEGERVARGTVK